MVNKWDLMEKDSKTADKLRKEMIERLAPMDYMPIIFASVHRFLSKRESVHSAALSQGS